MIDFESTGREELRRGAGDLDRLRQRLQRLHADLPVSARADLMLLGEEEADFATEARRTIECVLRDHVEPLIEILRAAAEYAMPGGDAPGAEGGC